ncbi:MAG: glycosyltransferase family 87 protein [Planctomycetota bacterium]|nr:glycosyltransferase family 87 protein [Planctomycetota bacterium]
MPPRLFPALLVGMVMLASIGLLRVAQVYTRADLFPVSKYYLSLDHGAFYFCGTLVAQGKSPYTDPRYVTPPLPARLFSLWSRFVGPDTTLKTSFFACLFAVLAAHLLVAWRLFDLTTRERAVLALLGSLLILHSYPLHMLIDRGNIDGYVLLATVLGLACVHRQGWEVAGGALFALAIALKVYPVLIIAPLFLQRRWRALAGLGVALALLILIEPGLYLEWVQLRLRSRSTNFVIPFNGSLTNFFQLFAWLNSFVRVFKPVEFDLVLGWIAGGTFVGAMGMMAWLDWRRPASASLPTSPPSPRPSTRSMSDDAVAAALYLPLMVSVPRMVFHYSFVMLLPLLAALCVLWPQAATTKEARARRGLVVLAAVGLGVTQFPAYEWATATGLPVFHLIPATGLAALIAACVAIKWHTRRHSIS